MQLISNWQQFYKMWSIWAMAAIAVLPEIYNAAVELGLLDDTIAPKSLSYTLKLLAFIGIVARLIKQAALQMQTEQPPKALP